MAGSPARCRARIPCPPGGSLRALAVSALLLAGLLPACTDDGPPPPPPSPWVLDSVAFVTTGVTGDGNQELYLVENRGDPEWTRLTDSDGLDHGAAWSPDGRRLVFHSDRTSGDAPDLDLFLVEPGSGLPPLNLTLGPGFDYLADWSPDGRYIAFLSTRPEAEAPDGSPGHIYLVDPQGRRARRVTASPVNVSLGPRWMPDGRSLLFARRTQEDGPTHLYRVAVDPDAPGTGPSGGRETRLVADTFFNYTPAPSPDGRTLAYTAEGSEGTRVVLTDADGGNPRVLVGDGYNYVEEWTPDGRWIVVTRWYPAFQRTDAWLLSADGSQPHRPVLDPVHRSTRGVAFRPEG